MAGKKVAFGTTPKPTAQTKTAEQWVENRNETGTKRLTIDVSPDLHRRIKMGCASRGVKMADAIRELLENNFHD